MCLFHQMTNLGTFDQKVVGLFNIFAETYALSPGKTGERSYMVGYVTKCNHLHADFWVEEWVRFSDVTYLPWGTLFIQRWDKIKNEIIFNGSICSMTRETDLSSGKDEQPVVAEDRITRRVKTLTVAELLDLAQPILFDDELGPFKGGVEEISIVKNANIPTINFV